MDTLEQYLQKNAAAMPSKPAVICNGEALTYASLWGRVAEEAKELHAGQVIPVRALRTADFLVRYFAIHLAGAVALPLEQDIPDAAFDSIGQLYKDYTPPAGTADILYTTGTTGQSKGVMISAATIVADAENLIGAMGFDKDLVFIINGPLNHIGSLSKVYPVIMQGGTLNILEGMKDLNAFFAAVDAAPDKVATFLVPSAIRMLLGLAKGELAARSGKFAFIETGAAPMAHSDMLELCRVLPQTRLYNTYASTETGICCTYNFNDGECLAGCLGLPMKHSRVFITADGKVACQGRTLMTGYAAEPELTASVLRDGTVYTADNAYLDEKGRLRLTGRDDDVINIGGFKVAPSEVEDVALSHPSVKDCICICEDTELGNMLTLLVVQKEDTPFDKRALAVYMSQKLERYKVPVRYKQVPSINRTFNGKLDRKSYRKK